VNKGLQGGIIRDRRRMDGRGVDSRKRPHEGLGAVKECGEAGGSKAGRKKVVGGGGV